jgi:hypothetical protein
MRLLPVNNSELKTNMKSSCFPLLLAALVAGCASPKSEMPVSQPQVQTGQNTDGFTNTPIVPGTSWHVHDPNRPQPRIVTPGTFSTEEIPGKPPSDAIVLFDGTSISGWRNQQGEPARWKIEKNELVESKGDIFTKQEFGDIQLHLEFMAPKPKGDGQNRGNSGVFLMGKYEVQILDCYNNLTYADGTVGAMYGQHPPLANVAKPPGEWQVYDIVFHPPAFDESGTLKSPAIVTVFLNGVLVQDHQSYMGPTGWKIVAHYSPQPATGPISLQDHNNVTRFRNIWVRPLEPADK